MSLHFLKKMSPTDSCSINCEFCDFADRSKSEVSSHLLLRHHCTVSYSCILCEFCCEFKEIFSLHLLSHRPFDETRDNSEEYVSKYDEDGENILSQDVSWTHKLLNAHARTNENSQIVKRQKSFVRRANRGRGTFKGSAYSIQRQETKVFPGSDNPSDPLPTRAPATEGNHLKFKCPSCESCFQNPCVLRRHSREIHPAAKLLPCPHKHDCSFVADTENALSNHSTLQHSKYECSDCSEKFPSASSLNVHMKSHRTSRASKRKAVEAICSRVAPQKLRKINLTTCGEASDVENTAKNDLSPEKKKVSVPKSRSNKRKRTGSKQKPQRVKHAARVKVKADTVSIQELVMEDTTELNADEYRYEEKGEKLERLSSEEETQKEEEDKLSIHLNDDGHLKKGGSKAKETHYTQSELMFLEVAKGIDRKATEFPCPHCPYVGKVFRNFKEHVMGHSEQRPYVCSLCCRSFVCKSKLVRHQRQVHNEARPFLCSECPYTGKSRSCLETHRLVMHPREEHLRFSCPHCPARFARASMLKTHVLRHNTGPHKLFSCAQCSFTTNYHRQFELHATLHTGKRCLCSLCGRAYSGQAQLRVHMRVQHSEQSFRCTLCDFVTKRPEGLTKHMKSHSTERPYPCPHCDYRGKRKAHLRRHMVRHSVTDQAPEKLSNSSTGLEKLPRLNLRTKTESTQLFTSQTAACSILDNHGSTTSAKDIANNANISSISTSINAHSINGIIDNSKNSAHFSKISTDKHKTTTSAASSTAFMAMNSDRWSTVNPQDVASGTVPSALASNADGYQMRLTQSAPLNSNYSAVVARCEASLSFSRGLVDIQPGAQMAAQANSNFSTAAHPPIVFTQQSSVVASSLSSQRLQLQYT